MAAGDSILPAAQTKAQYRALGGGKLIGEAFNAILDVSMSNSNILTQLQGGEGSNKPFTVRDDLTKGRMDKVNFNIGASLGAAGRRGTQVAVNYEEQLNHSSWQVQIDSLRVVVAWNEIVRAVATSGASWREQYAKMVGERLGQIEQEDMLMRMRQRSTSTNTIRPGNRTTLDTIKYDDTLDTTTLGRGISMLSRLGAKPAEIGKDKSGMPLHRFAALGGYSSFEPLWQDPLFTEALEKAEVRGSANPLWTGEQNAWRNTNICRWNIVDHDNPGPTGSTLQPDGILGDAITQATTANTVYGGGRTQAALGDSKVIYNPFEYFYGCDKLFGESISMGADVSTYYFVVVDPADGKWCLYSYTGAGVNSNGNSITVTNRLAAAASGAAVTTLGNWTWDASVNKEAFPTGSIIVQVNANVVPICDVMIFGAEAGAKAYGQVKNQRIEQVNDYGARTGMGIHSIYGSDMKPDTLGKYRGFIRVQCAYEVPGITLPQI